MNIIFKQFNIYEYKQKMYGKYTFSDGVNVFRNNPKYGLNKQNKVGKSSIIKSLMYTLGLKAKNWDPGFHYKDMIFDLVINIDSSAYKITRIKDFFSINDGDILSLSEYRNELASLLKIDLRLEHKNSTRKIVPYPEDYLMYFYVDQDSSWSNKLFLSVNTGISKYKQNAHKHIFNYLVGIDDDLVVDLKNKVQEVDEEIKSLNESLYMISYTEKLVIKDTYVDGPSISVKDFDLNIERFEKTFKELFSLQKDVKRAIYKNSKKVNKYLLELDELEIVFKDLTKNENVIKKSKCSVCSSDLTSSMLVKKYKIDNDKMEVAELHRKIGNKVEEAQCDRESLNSSLKNIRRQLESLQVELDKDLSSQKLNDLITLRVEHGKIEEFKKVKEEKYSSLISKKEERIKKNKAYNVAKKLLKERKEQVISSYQSYLTSIDLKTNKAVNLEDYSTLLSFNIKDTGTSKNIVLLSLFMAYFKLLEDYSKFNFPMILDTVIKDDHDFDNLKSMSEIINDIYFEMSNQVFYSYVENKNFKLTNSNINYIDLENRICNYNFEREQELYVDQLSTKIMDMESEINLKLEKRN